MTAQPIDRGFDIAVVGLGLAGLVAANVAARRGARVLVVGRGFGTTHLRSGCIDVLGYAGDRLVRSPQAEMGSFLESRAEHPYQTTRAQLAPVIQLVREIAQTAGPDLGGSLDANQLVATAAGTMRPTCLAPRSMIAQWDGKRVLAVGIDGYRDFEPALFAAAIPGAASALGIELSARQVVLDLPLFHRRHLGGMELARMLDNRAVRRELASAIKRHLRGVDLVALPAVLGLDESAAAHRELVADLEVPVVELPTLPPSIPGIRLQRALSASISRHGGRTMVGPTVRAGTRAGRIEHVELETAGRVLRRRVSNVILATGGLASGGLRIGALGAVTEPCAGLAVRLPETPMPDWFSRRFLEVSAQPAARIGIAVDATMRPLSASGDVTFENLYACGDLLWGAERTQEKSSEGIACASALRAAEVAAA